jgi:hypothetical protein
MCRKKGGHGFICMSPLYNKNIHIKPLVDGFIIVDSAISIVPILVISPNLLLFIYSTGFDTTEATCLKDEVLKFGNLFEGRSPKISIINTMIRTHFYHLF